jgi:hypothetical protein
MLVRSETGLEELLVNTSHPRIFDVRKANGMEQENLFFYEATKKSTRARECCPSRNKKTIFAGYVWQRQDEDATEKGRTAEDDEVADKETVTQPVLVCGFVHKLQMISGEKWWYEMNASFTATSRLA